MIDDPKRIRLHEIQTRDGSLKTEAVIEDARDPDSPLHSEFEWDPEKAHPLYLKIRAREIITRYQIIVEVPETSGKVTRIRINEFQSLLPDRENGGGYRSVSSIMSKGDHEVLVHTARQEAKALLKRLENITRLGLVSVPRLISALDEFIGENPQDETSPVGPAPD